MACPCGLAASKVAETRRSQAGSDREGPARSNDLRCDTGGSARDRIIGDLENATGACVSRDADIAAGLGHAGSEIDSPMRRGIEAARVTAMQAVDQQAVEAGERVAAGSRRQTTIVRFAAPHARRSVERAQMLGRLEHKAAAGRVPPASSRKAVAIVDDISARRSALGIPGEIGIVPAPASRSIAVRKDGAVSEHAFLRLVGAGQMLGSRGSASSDRSDRQARP